MPLATDYESEHYLQHSSSDVFDIWPGLAKASLNAILVGASML